MAKDPTRMAAPVSEVPAKGETRLRRARLAVFGSFLLNGFVQATWVTSIPAIAKTTNVSNAALGTTLLALGVGSIIAMQFAGYATTRFGSREMVAGGMVVLAVGLSSVGFSSSGAQLFMTLLLFGLGNGTIEVAMNDQSVLVQRHYGRPIISAFHAFFSVGGALGAGLGALMQAMGFQISTALVVAGVVSAVLGILVSRNLLAFQTQNRDEESKSRTTHTPRAIVIRRAIVLGGLAFAFMLAEGMVSDWSALHATQHLRQSAPAAALAYFFFAAAMTTGRFVVDRVVGKVGPVAVVRYGGLIAIAGLVLVITSMFYSLTLVGWALFGIGLSGAVPQIFTAAGALGRDDRGAILLARIVSVGYIGMLAGPAIIGWISSAVGINAALSLPLALVVMGSMLATATSTAELRAHR